MRFFVYISLLFAILPLVMLRPFFGLCIYYVVSLLQPKMLCWRPDFQDAMLVGVPLIVGAFALGTKRRIMELRHDRQGGKRPGLVERVIKNPLFEAAWPLAVFLLLIIYISITRLLVPYPLSNTTSAYRALIKVFLVVALMTGMASDVRRFRVLYIVVALATAFWAIKGGLKVILLGPHQVHGRTYDNNLFALLSVMALPMVFYFALSVKHARWRPVLLVFAALICLGIIGSRSRAGFVAFAFVLVCMAWSSRYRLRAFFAVGLVVAVALGLSGKEIQERVTSIIEYRQDRSAVSRFATWDAARQLLSDHPLIGVGFGNFEIAKERLLGGRKAAHNIYLQNAAELGVLGHPLWLIIIFGTIISLYRFMRRSRRLPVDMRWAYYWSRGLVLGMMAFCIHGMFHNEEYLELMFILIGMSVCLRTATRRAMQERSLLDTAEKEPENKSSAKRPTNPSPGPRHPGLLFEPPRRPGLSYARIRSTVCPDRPGPGWIHPT
jgi:probable O-glycosylation ligase (exosortase A-associated)